MRICLKNETALVALDTIHSLPHRPHRRQLMLSGRTGVFVALSPIEKAISEKKDRRRAHEARLKSEGFIRANLWMRREAVPHVRFLVKCLNATNGRMLEDLKRLAEKWEREK